MRRGATHDEHATGSVTTLEIRHVEQPAPLCPLPSLCGMRWHDRRQRLVDGWRNDARRRDERVRSRIGDMQRRTMRGARESLLRHAWSRVRARRVRAPNVRVLRGARAIVRRSGGLRCGQRLLLRNERGAAASILDRVRAGGSVRRRHGPAASLQNGRGVHERQAVLGAGVQRQDDSHVRNAARESLHVRANPGCRSRAGVNSCRSSGNA